MGILITGDHYPLPDPVNSYVSGPLFTTNCGMNEPVHLQAIAANPPSLPFGDEMPGVRYDQGNPNLEVPHHIMEAAQEEEEEDDDDDEKEIAQTEADEAGTSNPRRRGREERFEQEITSINQRLENLDVSVQHMSDRQEAHWAQFNAQNEAHWALFTAQSNTQWTNFNALYDERWNLYVQHQQEFRAYWPPPPPPEQ